ncbi:MAG: molybdate ABC transporter substrate-binding protein [Leptospirales bacterium]
MVLAGLLVWQMVGIPLARASDFPPLRIAAAADLSSILPSIAKEFTRKTGITVSISYGSSGVLFLQTTRHAPFDVFMSADSFYPARLMRQGYGIPGTDRVYARGGLVLWFSKQPDLSAGKSPIRALLDPSIGKIALANPQVAPYGRVSIHCLKVSGLDKKLRSRWILGDTVSQVAQYLEIGSAGAGFLPFGLGMRLQKEKGWIWPVPERCAPFLLQKMVVLKRTQRKKAAISFESFVTGPAGRALLLREGFN